MTLGVLDDRFLGRDRPVGESRLLWEIGKDATDVRDLRRRLDLDSGYVSRLLRSLEADGLVTVSTDDADRRRRSVKLTGAGRDERAVLDERSDDLAGSLLQALDERERVELVDAMRRVERLLARSRASTSQVPPDHSELRWCLDRYVIELGERFDDGFDVTRSNRADAVDLAPPRGLAILMRVGSDPAGCGLLKFGADGVAELKRMWVASRFRGFGLGSWLLADLERQAGAHGSRLVRLETNRNLTEAISMYRCSGYREVPAFNDEPYAHHWFEKALPKT